MRQKHGGAAAAAAADDDDVDEFSAVHGYTMLTPS
jgi:hypothetical protein